MSEYFYIKGGNHLNGRYEVRGAKNAVLPLLAMGIMSNEDVVIDNCPMISDVSSMIDLLSALGVHVVRNGRSVRVCGQAVRAMGDEKHFKSMRSSMFMLGALLSTLGEVHMPLPGGCSIGLRPLDIHIQGIRAMGGEVECDGQYLNCYAKKLHGEKILMKYPSVGATENLMMCATLADGKTTLVNCAREPEICSLADGLRAMGARIHGDGTSVIEIDGVDSLSGTKITPIGDRIVAGTIMCATALCGGSVEIDGVNKNHLGALIDVLSSKHCKISGDEGGVHILSTGKVKAFDVISAPYPLFPTDLQAPILSVACFSDGICHINETVFENRFSHAYELQKTGAKISINKSVATVVGNMNRQNPYPMHGTNMYASDLRGGAALVLAGLKMRDESKVFNTQFVDRGYEKIEDIFCSLGGYVIRKRD